jgi:hypothetical protein
MKAVIDRIEEGIAVLEFDDGYQLELPAQYIPGAREGAVVEIKIDETETGKRRKAISDLQKDLLAGRHLKNKKKK